jgi:hypothetical protein
MPSTYSNLKIQLMATGENNTSWGDVTNVNLGTALEEAIVGSADVTFASANVTLTLTNTNASQTARNLRLRCTGTTGGSTRNLVVPSIEKPYIIQNDCADSIVVKTAAGTGVTVSADTTTWVYSDGVNVVSAFSYAPELSTVDIAAINGIIGTLTSVNITTSNLTSTNLATTNLAVTNLGVTNATATNLNATTAVLTNLTSTNATTTNLTATTVLDAGTIGAAAPGFRGLPQNAQTSAYTLVLSDIGKQISITTGGVVIPANASVAFPIGAAVVIYNNSGTSQDISITSDTLRLAGTTLTGTAALAEYGLATCVKVGTTTWVISGAGVS